MIDGTISYDDSQLQRLFADMEPVQRLKALRGAFRRVAGDVRRTAVNNLRGSLRSNKGLERGIRTVVFKKTAGFQVTIGSKVRRGASGSGKSTWTGFSMHTNGRGKSKPVLIWAEEGTENRRTKSRTKIFTRSRKGHSTGRMRRYGFMRQTSEQVRGTVTETLHTEIVKSVKKTATKYGCK